MRIYSDSAGVARVEWRAVPLRGDVTGRLTSPRFPAGELFFRETPASHDRGKHLAPQRQLIVVVSGGGQIELDDGSVHRFGVGDLIFAEDTDGLGHVTRNEDSARGFVHVCMPDSFDVRDWPLLAA